VPTSCLLYSGPYGYACPKDFHSTNSDYFCVCHVSNELALELSMLEPFPREKNLL